MTPEEKKRIQSFLPEWERACSSLFEEEKTFLENGFLFRHYKIRKPGRRVCDSTCRILFFTDLHVRKALTASFGGGAVFLSWEGTGKIRKNLQEAIDSFSPDLLLCGGDLTGEFSAISPAVELLRSLESKSGKFLVPGNWDKRRRSPVSRREWEEKIALSSFTYLCNEEEKVAGGVIYGLDDFKSGLPHYRSLMERNWSKVPGFQILLSHNPDSIPFLGTTPLAEESTLILCGHTHGGQILLPGCGRAVLTSTYSGNKLASGIFRHKRSGSFLIVSSGIGTTWIHKRYNLPPEVVGITLEY